MNSEMMEALENIEREKGISIEIMLEALANALVTAYKRMPSAAEEALVEIDIETGDIKVIAQELCRGLPVEGEVEGLLRDHISEQVAQHRIRGPAAEQRIEAQGRELVHGAPRHVDREEVAAEHFDRGLVDPLAAPRRAPLRRGGV